MPVPLINDTAIPESGEALEDCTRLLERNDLSSREERAWPSLRDAITVEPLQAIEAREFEAPRIDVSNASC